MKYSINCSFTEFLEHRQINRSENMLPRRYSMSVRAEKAAQTRERIMDAALVCYRETGIAATSLQAVARRAKVSAATVLNHFGSADGLARAVVDRLTAALHIPDDREWPQKGRRARVRRLVREMFEFYERSRPWFDVFRTEMAVDPALREGEARYWQAVGELYARVFAEALDDDRVRGAVFGLTTPNTFIALRDAGMSVGDAAELIAGTLNRTAAVGSAAHPSSVSPRHRP
jgi:AcrR family transcriptional regulator